MTDACWLDRRAIDSLLLYFSKNAYKAKSGDAQNELVLKRCLHLFARDYVIETISNVSGDLCAHYPGKIIIPVARHNRKATKESLTSTMPSSSRSTSDSGNVGVIASVDQLCDAMQKARIARCRSRVVVPVILYGHNKYVCRSSTLSSGAELYGRSGLDWLLSRGGGEPTASDDSSDTASFKSIARAAIGDWELFDRVRGEDIRLLKFLRVQYICDLMVEQKKVKFGMPVTSSEKVDKERRYAEFDVLSIPYPGCELFSELKASNYMSDKVHFDWTQGFVNATIDVPPLVMDKLMVDWKNYKTWNLTKITQNYLKLFLHILHNGDGGLLVHCISGWDRTPLFISLIRLSLWADGAIHQSLTALEILYLTLAYDWLLFGHQLASRLSKGEEILFFCFHFLNRICDEEYSVSAVHRNLISQFDSELFVEGVMQEAGLAGSTTSLNSTSSSSSGQSAVSSSALHSTGTVSGVQDTLLQSDGVRSSSHWSPKQPHRNTVFFKNDCSPKSSVEAQASAIKSVPISVPVAAAAAKPAENSPGSHGGSWQLISISGSPQGSVQMAPRSSPLTGKRHSVTPTLEIECDQPGRRKRLEEVRELFLSSYYSTIRPPDQEQKDTASLAGNIAGMISRLAGHIGIEGAGGNAV